jgi:hypothetical protein
MTYLHGNTVVERWREMTLAEQLGNIGSEVSRAANSQEKDDVRFNKAVDRALELFDLTLSDPRWKGRLLEVGRMRDVFCDTVLGAHEYGDDLKSLVKYFDQFVFAAHFR